MRKKVPVLTVRQPWATLIAMGVKTAEMRTWRTPSRPKHLLIHAAARRPSAADIADMVDDVNAYCCDDISDVARALEFMATDPAGWPRGRLVAVARMDWPAASLGYVGKDGKELFAWRIKRVRRIDSDHVRGQLGIFRIDRDLVRLPQRQGLDLPAHEKEEIP